MTDNTTCVDITTGTDDDGTSGDCITVAIIYTVEYSDHKGPGCDSQDECSYHYEESKQLVCVDRVEYLNNIGKRKHWREYLPDDNPGGGYCSNSYECRRRNIKPHAYVYKVKDVKVVYDYDSE